MLGGNIVTNAEFLQLFWNMFLKERQNWLADDQIDPFNRNNPLDAPEFCDDLQRYWTMKFKDKEIAKDKNKNKGDNLNQQNSQKKARSNNSGDRTGNNTSQAGRGGPQGRCGGNGGSNDAEAVDKALEDSKAVAAFRSPWDSKAANAATIMIPTVAVAKVITTEIKAHIVEAPRKDFTIRATGAVTITMCTLLPYSLDNKVTRPTRAFTTLLCPARS